MFSMRLAVLFGVWLSGFTVLAAQNRADILKKKFWNKGFDHTYLGFEKKEVDWFRLMKRGNLNRQAVSLSKGMVSTFIFRSAHAGFYWQSDDMNTDCWRPQGITSQFSAARKDAARKFLVISWYYRSDVCKKPNDKGARISFVDVTDMSRIRYRHVLLVEPKPDGQNFNKLNSHAGGIAWYKNYLYVARTNDGFDVFDMRDILPAVPDSTKNRIGFIDGRPYAMNYRFVLPRTRLYKLSQNHYGSKPHKFSFVSIDHTVREGHKQLVSGAYKESTPSYLHTWGLDPNTGLLGYFWPRETHKISGVKKIQGAAFFHNHIWLSTSEELLRLRRNREGSENYGGIPVMEDLTYVPSSRNLWMLTEEEGRRFVWAVKKDRIDG